MFHKSSQSSHSRLSRNSRTENLPALAAFNSAPLLDSPTKLEVRKINPFCFLTCPCNAPSIEWKGKRFLATEIDFSFFHFRFFGFRPPPTLVQNLRKFQFYFRSENSSTFIVYGMLQWKMCCFCMHACCIFIDWISFISGAVSTFHNPSGMVCTVLSVNVPTMHERWMSCYCMYCRLWSRCALILNKK